MNEQPTLTESQTAEVLKLKAYFPFRIVYGVLYPDGTFGAFADVSRRRINALVRKGCAVFEATVNTEQ